MTPVEPPKKPEQGYHLTDDLTTKAINWIRMQHAVAPDRPFFAYYTTKKAKLTNILSRFHLCKDDPTRADPFGKVRDRARPEGDVDEAWALGG